MNEEREVKVHNTHYVPPAVQVKQEETAYSEPVQKELIQADNDAHEEEKARYSPAFEKAEHKAHELAITCFIAGIASLVMLLGQPDGAVLAVIGLVCGIIAKKKGNDETLCTGGIVISIIGLVLNIIFYIAYNFTKCM